ncbi:response regulator [Pontibacter mangrovi]|uniref:Response regulator n=1 Tax=Pontibacter mangrovi TaxID=2589816 RepID=A0A501W1I6_9BACT|nr:response regulator [Pontibacter mangrovi]TPE43479.1 response regulator [Pontibacter mangrovi]
MNNCKILVVDDEFSSRYLIQDLLTSVGMGDGIRMAASGKEALAILQDCVRDNSFPELILLDIVMPQFTGFDFLKEYATLRHPGLLNTRIVLLSYYGSRSFREQAAQYAVDAYFQKPLTKEKLEEILVD